MGFKQRIYFYYIHQLCAMQSFQNSETLMGISYFHDFRFCSSEQWKVGSTYLAADGQGARQIGGNQNSERVWAFLSGIINHEVSKI